MHFFSMLPATDARILPVILAGGVGARLAPISTDERPKPFVPLADGASLLTHTLLRVAASPMFLPPLLIGRAQDRFALLNHARAAGVVPAAILLEPQSNNTAAAMALAVAWAQAHCPPDTMLALLPADHWIAPQSAWIDTMEAAAIAAREAARLCLLASPARSADPGYGYLQLAPERTAHRWCAVERFIEKPADATTLIAAGACWNMGQCVGMLASFIHGFESTAPELLPTMRRLLHAADNLWEFTELPATQPTLPPLPFDRVVLEHVPSIAMRFTGRWQDLGTVAMWERHVGISAADYQKLPRRTDRPWGYFEVLGDDPQSATLRKRLVLYPDCRLSLQRHRWRSESWEVLEGVAHVELNGEVLRLTVGQRITIGAGQWHRLANFHKQILIINEIQDGKCDEHDIERIEDDYGRK